VQYLSLEGQYDKQIRAALIKAQKDIETRLNGLAGKDNTGAKVERVQMQAQLAAIKARMNSLFSDVSQITQQGRLSAVSAASDVINRYTDELFNGFSDSESVSAVSAAEAYRAASGVDTMLARISSSHRDFAKDVYKTNAWANGVLDNLANAALAQGLSWRDLSKQVVGFINPNTPGGASYAARRYARSEINNAFHDSTIQRYQDSIVIQGMDWHLSKSHPEGDECDDLAAGGPYPKDAVPKKPHPFCLCFLTPDVPSDDDFLNKLFNGDYDDDLRAAGYDVTGSNGEIISPAEVESGMSEAERQRKALEDSKFDRSGNYNKARGWNSETRSAWTSYTEMGHQDMNHWLRDPEGMAAEFADDSFPWVEQAQKSVTNLSKLLEKNSLNADTVVARGVIPAPGYNPGDLKPGTLFADPAFLSTTTDMTQALDFASGRGRGPAVKGWTFVTRAPKGTPAVAGSDYQNELIFKAGQVQRVLSVDSTNRIVYTEMIP
jgi:hypothetical protein